MVQGLNPDIVRKFERRTDNSGLEVERATLQQLSAFCGIHVWNWMEQQVETIRSSRFLKLQREQNTDDRVENTVSVDPERLCPAKMILRSVSSKTLRR